MNSPRGAFPLALSPTRATVTADSAMKLVAQFILLLTCATVVGGAPAQLFAVTFYDREFIRIDTNAGTGTLITNLAISPYDIAVRGGELFILSSAVGGERLTQIDPWTGRTSDPKTFFSTITGGEGALDFARDGIAFATRSSNATGTLYRIDMAATNATLITGHGGLAPSLDGLAFAADDNLYGLSQNAGGAYGLYKINTNSGATTLVGNLGITFSAASGTVAGLAFAPDQTLFAAVGNQVESRLYRVNRLTGAATLVGPIGFPGVSGIRFHVPPPGPLAIERSASNLRVFWPHARGGNLETASSVTGVWARAELPIATNGVEAAVSLSPLDEQRFFRLGN
jgi:hypothetical protein